MKQVTLTSSFIAGIKKLENVPMEKADKLLRVVGSDVGEALIVGNEYGPGTPVDTGNARGHWYATIGEADEGNPDPPAVDKKGKATAGPDALTAAAFDQVNLVAVTAKMGDVVCFNNDADYIEELNNGHSQQAPNGMTDQVAANFESICRAAAEKLGILEA